MIDTSYPVRVEASLDPHLSRWLWLAKWLLAIPHDIVLAFLWLAFLVLSIFAFFAILLTGRYPRSIFDFNVGVMRWSWRVAYYAYGGLGTDRYPPFTLAEVADYPAHLTIAYPSHLSRGLVLVKWWLLALPHYVVVAVFLGGGSYLVSDASDKPQPALWGGGLIGLLVFVAAVVLLFTGRYPQSIFDFILGMNRWVLRVAAYVGLMTDDYPPFRLDMGGREPGSGELVAVDTPAPSEPSAPAGPRPWTAGRVISAFAGSLVFVVAGALIVGGVALAVVDHSARDDRGYLMTDQAKFSTAGSAISSEVLKFRNDAAPRFFPEALLGDAKIEFTSKDKPVFVGVADAGDATTHLFGVSGSMVTDFRGDVWNGGTPVYRYRDGTRHATSPAASDIWVASASGTGRQSLAWPLESGDWTVVVMNADGTPGVETDLAVGATLPAIGWVVGGLLTVGGFCCCCPSRSSSVP